jgi:hypothetical protein
VAKRILIAALLTPPLLLIGLGSATAKEAITRLRLCGASDCVTVQDMTTLQILMTYIGASPAKPPSPAAAPYFTFAPRPTRQWPSSYPRYVYVPSAKLVRIHYPPSASRWSSVGDAAPLLHRLTAGIRAYPPPSGWHAVTVTARATAHIAGPQIDLATGFQTTRTFAIPAGRATRNFTFRERSGVILVNRLTVVHGIRAFVDARIPRLAGARVMSWPSRNDPSLSCRRKGAFDVCTQAEEWCPMPQATWRFHLVKLSGPPGAIRFDYLVAPPPPQG